MRHLARRCDFELLAHELRDLINNEERKAPRRGHHHFYSPELVLAVHAFLRAPSHAAVGRLQQAAPELDPLFKACSPGGHLYEFKRILDA